MARAKYSFPAGISIMEGLVQRTLVKREVLFKQPFLVDGAWQTLSVYDALGPDGLSNIGIKSFVEDTIPSHYTGGVPVDVETATQVHRTYPNPVFEPAPWRSSLMAEIQAKKIIKRDGGFTVDGVLFDSDAGANVQYLNFFTQVMSDPTYTVANWKASNGTWVEMNATLFAKVSTAFALNTAAAFDWQAAMQAALDAAPDTYAGLKAVEDLIKEVN